MACSGKAMDKMDLRDDGGDISGSLDVNRDVAEQVMESNLLRNHDRHSLVSTTQCTEFSDYLKLRLPKSCLIFLCC